MLLLVSLLSTAAYAQDAATQAFLTTPTPIWERLVSLVGLAVFVFALYAISEKRDRVDWKPVAWGLGMMFAVGAVTMIPGVKEVLPAMGNVVVKLLDFAGQGSTFVFQTIEPHQITTGTIPDLLAGKGTPTLFIGQISPPVKTFAFWILPTIVFFSALSSVLYHFGILQAVVKGIAWVMVRTMGTSGAETLCTAGNIFLGQTEAPLLVKPFLDKMTRSEIMAVMVGGFSTIAMGVLGTYASFLHAIPNAGGHLMIASIMSAPATFVAVKLVVPETEVAQTAGSSAVPLARSEGNALQAIAFGASDGMKLAINVAAMLIAIVALVAMANWALQTIGFYAGFALDLQTILGWIFLPISLLMGVPWGEASVVSRLIGEKLVLTEFVAYIDLGGVLDKGTPVLTQRSAIMAAYALCGFANFASIGIQVGGIGAVAPNKVADLASLGMKAMLVGSLVTCMNAAVIGIFV